MAIYTLKLSKIKKPKVFRFVNKFREIIKIIDCKLKKINLILSLELLKNFSAIKLDLHEENKLPNKQILATANKILQKKVSKKLYF